jgi:hypothetical protein
MLSASLRDEAQREALKRQILKAAGLYFVIVFGAGFVLGTIRVLLVVPHLGVRTAELMETPVMVAISFFAARWMMRHFAALHAAAARIAIGLVALALLLGAELAFVHWLQGLTVREYIASRDPVSGAGYVIALGLFAIMPLLVCRR